MYGTLYYILYLWHNHLACLLTYVLNYIRIYVHTKSDSVSPYIILEEFAKYACILNCDLYAITVYSAIYTVAFPCICARSSLSGKTREA